MCGALGIALKMKKEVVRPFIDRILGLSFFMLYLVPVKPLASDALQVNDAVERAADSHNEKARVLALNCFSNQRSALAPNGNNPA